MASGGRGGGSSTGLAGMKRKAAGGRGRGDTQERREPRRGPGVAVLESMTAQLETAKNFYVFPALPASPPPLIGHDPGVRFNPFLAGQEGPRRDYQQYHGAQQYYTSDVFTRMMQASSGHVVPRRSYQHVDRNAGVVTAATRPLLPEHDQHNPRHTQHYSLLEQSKAWQHSLPEHDHTSHLQAQQHPLVEHDHRSLMKEKQYPILEHDHHSQMKERQYPFLKHDNHSQMKEKQYHFLKHDHYSQMKAQHPPLQHDDRSQMKAQQQHRLEHDHNSQMKAKQYHPLQHDHNSQMKAKQYPFLEHDQYRQVKTYQHPFQEHHQHRDTQMQQHHPLMKHAQHQLQTLYQPLQQHDHRQQEHAQDHHGQVRSPQVTTVDLVDSDDDAGGRQEVDLELRL